MTYIMESDDEGRRIEAKTDRTLTLDQLRWAGVREGLRVLDLGCAAGTTCRMMADLVGPGGRVVGIDASAKRVAEARSHVEHRSTIEYRLGDAARLTASEGEFDVSWSRFLFEYLPQPAAALTEMIRVTKLGGTICVSDLDGNCVWHHPMEPGVRAEIDDALRTLGEGFNPRVGLELYTMFVDAGLREVEVDIRPYHLIAGTIDREKREHWLMKLEGVANALRARGWSRLRSRDLVKAFLAHLDDPRTFTYSSLFTVRGVVRAQRTGE